MYILLLPTMTMKEIHSTNVFSFENFELCYPLCGQSHRVIGPLIRFNIMNTNERPGSKIKCIKGQLLCLPGL